MDGDTFVKEPRSWCIIRLDPARVIVQAPVWPHETVISVDIGGKTYEAMIPTHSLPQDHSYVPGQRIGKLGDRVVVVLPVGNDGTTKWLIPEADLDSVQIKHPDLSGLSYRDTPKGAGAMNGDTFVKEPRSWCKIRLDPARVKVQSSTCPHETVISVDIGGKTYEAMIPTHSLPQDHSYVPGQRVGKRGDKVVVVLPVGNDGTTKWLIPEADLDSVQVK